MVDIFNSEVMHLELSPKVDFKINHLKITCNVYIEPDMITNEKGTESKINVLISYFRS